ncbi:MAG: hypothetical protein ACXVS6_21960 [Solirubrobacteraceae bacterium]
MPMAAAVIHLAEGKPEQAIAVLDPATEDSAPAIHRPSAATEAQWLRAVAYHELGDRREAESSLERALDLAEPEGLVLPFILVRHRNCWNAIRVIGPRMPCC